MIGEYLIRKGFKLVKVYNNTRGLVTALDAIDNEIVLDKRKEDGSLPLLARARPYLKDPYESYFCGDPNCMTAVGDDCPSGKCRPFDDYFDGYGASILTGSINGLVVVDIDPRSSGPLPETFKKIKTLYGPLPKTWAVRTPRGGCHLYYKYQSPLRSFEIKQLPGVEFMGENKKAMIPPYSSEYGQYKWEVFPSDKNLADLPKWIISCSIQSQNFQPQKYAQWYSTGHDDDREHVIRALALIPPWDCNNDMFCSIGYACCSAGFIDEFINWSRSDPNQSKWVTAAQVRNFKISGAIKLGSLFKIAEDYGFTFTFKGASN